MKFTPRPLSLLIALALGSVALGCVTLSRSPAASSARSEMQAIAVSDGDASVPSASTVTLPIGEAAAAPTF